MVMRARQKIRAPRRGLTAAKGTDFEELWSVLSSSLQEIHTKNASSLSFEELYRNAYRMVLMTREEELYDRVKQLEQNWLCNEVQKRVISAINSCLMPSGEADAQDLSGERRAAGEKFLTVLKEAWEDHQLCMGMITDVLMYMDRNRKDHRKPSIYTAAMALFRDFVVHAPVDKDAKINVSGILQSTALYMVQLERTGHIIERPLIRHCIYMLEGLYETMVEEESLKLYLVEFEPVFLETSRIFYRAEGQRLLEMNDATTFCQLVLNRIAEEKERCLYTLSLLTEPKIESVLDEELIARNINQVINLEGTGVRNMIDHHRLDTLQSIYDLTTRVDKKKIALTTAVQERIRVMGQEINTLSIAAPQPKPSEGNSDRRQEKEKEKPINQQTVSAVKWVDDILRLKRKYDDILEKSFRSDHSLQSSITNSFSEFINSNDRCSEYLSLFFDENLRKGIKGKTENEVDLLLDNGITLLRYIKDKDLFETYYKKHLSRRLLMKRAISMDAERQMISKMKMEVGNQFTQRLESMFKDMAISEDMTSNYKNHIRRTGDPDQGRIDLEVNVLTSTMWPLEIMSNRVEGETQLPVTLPKEIETIRQSFERFYLGKHNGRKLSWQANMGTADIRAMFPKRDGKIERHELNVSTYGMIILMLFNDVGAGESLTYGDIQRRTRIADYDLIRNLQSLAVAPKTRVLKKDPMSKDIKPTDRFLFNADFHSPFMKVRIGVVSGGSNKVENKDQRKDTEKRMNDERGGSIEAAIVRIMKQRKQLVHSQLMSEVLSQLASRFVPDVNMVKRRIESLIDREYLERVSEEPPTYGYVA